MTRREYHGNTISQASERIEQGLSPLVLAEECLDRISRDNARLRAMIFVDEDHVLEDARQAEVEIRAGRRRGPLHGIPIAIKDNLDVKGWPTTLGSRLHPETPAPQTARCIANLRDRGAIIIGKANLHELCVGGAENRWFGKVVNPLDEGRGTGGTSSGAAAAVAGGFCYAAIGTDTGGSNRSPAAATGLFGFKPTNGLIDTHGLHGTAPSLDCVGVLARTVGDTRLVTDALAGREMHTETPTLPARIALCPDLTGSVVDSKVMHAIEGWLKRPDIEIVEIPFHGREELMQTGLDILMHEFASNYAEEIRARSNFVGAAVHDFLEASLRVGDDAYRRALASRKKFRDGLAVTMEGVDALAVPTSPGLAPRLEDEITCVGGTWVPWGLAGGAFRRWANMLAMPALATPIGIPDDFPASVQLATLPGRDAHLLSLAAHLERS